MRVSVVLPTFRRADLLGRCLDALGSQTLAASEYEVIVADDAADAATRRQVERFAERAPMAVVYVPVEGVHGPAAARNAGWRTARADLVAFTDDDTQPEPGWLAAGVEAFGRDPALMAASGRVVVPL